MNNDRGEKIPEDKKFLALTGAKIKINPEK